MKLKGAVLVMLLPLAIVLSGCGSAGTLRQELTDELLSTCCDPAARPGGTCPGPDCLEEPPVCCADGKWALNPGDGSSSLCADKAQELGSVCSANQSR